MVKKADCLTTFFLIAVNDYRAQPLFAGYLEFLCFEMQASRTERLEYFCPWSFTCWVVYTTGFIALSTYSVILTSIFLRGRYRVVGLVMTPPPALLRAFWSFVLKRLIYYKYLYLLIGCLPIHLTSAIPATLLAYITIDIINYINIEAPILFFWRETKDSNPHNRFGSCSRF